MTFPSTLGALLGFLGLVAPGLVFQLLRERKRPYGSETVFREVARVALGSLVFTLSSVGLLLVVNLGLRFLPDFGRWAAEGLVYVAESYVKIAAAVILEVVLACALALLSHSVLAWMGIGAGEMRYGGVWYNAFRSDRPDGADVWIKARLTNGASVAGYLRHYTPDDKIENRELSIGGANLHYASLDEEMKMQSPRWDSVCLRATEISSVHVAYLDSKSGEPVPRRKVASSPGADSSAKALVLPISRLFSLRTTRKTSINGHSQEM